MERYENWNIRANRCNCIPRNRFDLFPVTHFYLFPAKICGDQKIVSADCSGTEHIWCEKYQIDGFLARDYSSLASNCPWLIVYLFHLYWWHFLNSSCPQFFTWRINASISFLPQVFLSISEMTWNRNVYNWV